MELRKKFILDGNEVLLPCSEILFNTKRIITINEEITDRLADIVNNSIRCLSGSGEDIFLYINSPGGSISAALSIVDCMDSCGCDIVTVGTGCCASMGAFLLACCGTPGKRYLTKNCEVMIHQPLMGGAGGQASDIKIHAEHILSVRERLYKMLSERTGQPIDVIAQQSERDTFFTADEAIRFGLADKIGDPYFDI